MAQRFINPAAKLYAYGAALVALAFIAVSFILADPDLTREVIITAVILAVISLVLEFGVDFRLLISGSTSFSTVSYVAMIFMLPFPLPALAGGCIILLSDLRARKVPSHLALNFANYTLTLGVASLIWHLYAHGQPLTDLPRSLTPVLVIGAVIAAFYLVNVIILNGYLAIVNNRPMSYIWVTQDLEFLLPYLSLEVVGVLAALVWETSPSILPLLAVPAVTTYLAFETIERLQRQTQEAMIAMADAIDARDPYTAQHSRRVTDLARRLAEVYGLKPREIERLELAARVHDIGKIGISDQILHKSGPLTDKEWETMREHPVIGEQMLLPYRQFRHQALIVRSHHERWDGRGYPDSLRGQNVPISARIIGVADAFDAMTSTRPYRPAMSRERAVEEIRKNAAIQFDPMVVASFLQVMEEADKIRPITAVLDQPGEDDGPWYSSLP